MKESGKLDSKLLVFLLPVIYVILGAILLIYKSDALHALCILLAAVLALAGILRVLLYLVRTPDRNFSSNGFCIGLLETIFGVIALTKSAMLLQYIPIVLGCLVVYNGARELQNALDVHRLKMGNARAILIIAAVNIVLGVVLVLWPFDREDIRLLISALGLILSGLTDFVVSLFIWFRLSKNRKAAAAAVEESMADDNAPEFPVMPAAAEAFAPIVMENTAAPSDGDDQLPPPAF